MNNMPLISLVIPVYNVENYLDRCVESILAQSYKNLQILLVDDGSPDHSGAICDRWQEKVPQITAIHKKNGGLSSARNEGLRYATGEYVMFVDSDDVIHPEMCRHLLTGMQRHNAQIATCEPAHGFPGQPPVYTVFEDWLVLTKEESIRRLWYQKGFFPSVCTKMFRKNLFDNALFTEGILFEDVDILHRLLWQTETVVCTASALYGYSHREDSITTKQFSVRDLDILPISDRLLTFAAEHDPTLCSAAQAYAVTAALRVELNAPKAEAFTQGRQQARQLLKQHGRSVLFDKNTRLKSKCALLLYFLCRPLLRFCYKRIDRWK